MDKESFEEKLNSILEKSIEFEDESDIVPGANERPEVRKARFRSLYIVHAAMLLISLGISIMLTGTLPYVKRVRKIQI